MAGATELFKLSARLVLDSEGFDSGIDKAVKQGKQLGGVFSGAESGVTKLSSAMNVAKGVAGTVGKAVSKAFNIGKELVETAASTKALEESMATTFEGVEEQAAAAFAAVAEENNILERRLQESGLAFFRQFSGAGMDSANAMMNMENALSYAADAAAAYDISLEDASSMIRSFVRGNVEAGESIGIFVNESKRNELALAEYGKKWDKLTEAERQFLLLDLVGQTYEQNKVLGQGAREAHNYTNVVGNLAQAWEVAKSTMGEAALPPVTEALEKLSAWIQDPENAKIFETLGEGFGWVAGKAADAVVDIAEFTSKIIEAGQTAGTAGVIDAIFGEGTYDQFDKTRDEINRVLSDVTSPVGASENALNVLNKESWDAVKEYGNSLATSDNWWERNVSYPVAKAVTDAEQWLTGLFEKEEEPAEIVPDAISSAAMRPPHLVAQETTQRAYENAAAMISNGASLGLTPQIERELREAGALEVETEPVMPDDAKASLEAALDAFNLTAPVQLVPDYSNLYNWDVMMPGHTGTGYNAKGLEYVPYDDYLTRLHRGESVLNRVEAADWRSAQRGGGVQQGTGITREELLSILSGITVNMDGRSVGTMVTPYVSREQAAEYWRKR